MTNVINGLQALLLGGPSQLLTRALVIKYLIYQVICYSWNIAEEKRCKEGIDSTFSEMKQQNGKMNPKCFLE